MREIDDWCDEIAKSIDNKTFEFLNNSGYKIEKPYTREKALEIAEQLKRNGKKLTREVVVDKIILEDDEYKVINKLQFKLEELNNEQK